jgi:hypothetical protein
MNTAGTSGTHDTEAFKPDKPAGEATADKMKDTGKINSAQTPAAGEETGLPKSERQQEAEKETVYIEVLTQESGSQGIPTEFSYFAEEIPPSSGFRWWYAPVIAAPVMIAAGTTAATVLLVRRRRREEMEAAAAAAAAAAATRRWLNILRMRQALNQAGGLFQRGMELSRSVPGQIGTWRNQVPTQFGSWRNQVPTQFGSWRNQVPTQIGSWRNLATDQATRLRKVALTNAQSYADTARAQALATRNRTYKAVNNAGDQISGTASHTLAFGLGALVSAVATYVLRWRQRMMEADSEYTATTGANRMREEPIL